VGNAFLGTVTLIDSSNTVVDTIDVGNNPIALEYSPATESIYVANYVSATVTVIDSSDMVVDTIHVDDSPIFLEFSPATNNIYVYIPISGPNPTRAEVAVIDSNGIIVDTIDVGRAGNTVVSLNPYEYLEFSPATNNIYAVSRVSNDVIIIPP
jgi:YVTN family beta-propeller protein